MKLTLQLVVVVLNTRTKFRDNLFRFTLYTIIIYKVGDTRCHLRLHALIQHNFFHEIRTPTENEHARIVVIKIAPNMACLFSVGVRISWKKVLLNESMAAKMASLVSYLVYYYCI